jgi:hypothetical protein
MLRGLDFQSVNIKLTLLFFFSENITLLYTQNTAWKCSLYFKLSPVFNINVLIVEEGENSKSYALKSNDSDKVNVLQYC